MRNKTFFFNLIISLFFIFTLTSCDIIGGIFEAGMWVGLIGVVLVIALVFWLFSRFRR